jgi:uncharacterized protein YcbK (DUF882 family)
MTNSQWTRRSFLKFGGLSVLTLPSLGARSLGFYNLHTAERLNTVYWVNGGYVPEALADINRILRDYRTNEIYDISIRLLDTLCELRSQLDTSQPFELISGYRSPKTNAALRSQGHGVAENSLHLKGMAADVRVPGRDLAVLRKAAVALKAGGVGYYPASQFVHVDVGRVRTW